MDSTQVVKTYLSALDSRDVKKAAQTFDAQGEFKMMENMESIRGQSQLEELFSSWTSAFPDMKSQIVNIFGSGDLVVCESLVIGTHKGVMKGPMGEIQPTGKQIRVPTCDVYKVVNGKIKTLNCYFQSGTMMQQLGIGQQRAAA